MWVPYKFGGSIWILTNQKKCIEKCVLKYILLAFLLTEYASFYKQFKMACES